MVGELDAVLAEVRARRAERLGLTAESSFDDIVRAYLADNPGAKAQFFPEDTVVTGDARKP